jgi:hypothetical protein
LELLIEHSLSRPIVTKLAFINQRERADAFEQITEQTRKRINYLSELYSCEDACKILYGDQSFRNNNDLRWQRFTEFLSILSARTKEMLKEALSTYNQLQNPNITDEKNYQIYLDSLEISNDERVNKAIILGSNFRQREFSAILSANDPTLIARPATVTAADIVYANTQPGGLYDSVVKDMNKFLLYGIRREDYFLHFSKGIITALISGEGDINKIKEVRQKGLEKIGNISCNNLETTLNLPWRGIRGGNIIPLLDKQRDRRIKVKNFMQKVFQSPYFQDQFEKFCTDNKIENYQELLPQ